MLDEETPRVEVVVRTEAKGEEAELLLREGFKEIRLLMEVATEEDMGVLGTVKLLEDEALDGATPKGDELELLLREGLKELGPFE